MPKTSTKKQESAENKSAEIDTPTGKENLSERKISNGAVFFITLFLLIAGWLLIHNHDAIMRSVNGNGAETVVEESDKNDSTEDEAVSDDAPKQMNGNHQDDIVDPVEKPYSVGPEPPILMFGPAPETPKEKIENMNPYDHEVELDKTSSFAPAMPKQTVLRKAAEYRRVLASVQNMMHKFEHDKDFGYELRKMQKYKIAEHIVPILKKMEEYNNRLINPDLKSHEEVDLGLKLLSNFVRVKKATDEYKSAHELKAEIQGELKVLNDYLYSEEFSEQFFNE